MQLAALQSLAVILTRPGEDVCLYRRTCGLQPSTPPFDHPEEEEEAITTN